MAATMAILGIHESTWSDARLICPQTHLYLADGRPRPSTTSSSESRERFTHTRCRETILRHASARDPPVLVSILTRVLLWLMTRTSSFVPCRQHQWSRAAPGLEFDP